MWSMFLPRLRATDFWFIFLSWEFSHLHPVLVQLLLIGFLSPVHLCSPLPSAGTYAAEQKPGRHKGTDWRKPDFHFSSTGQTLPCSFLLLFLPELDFVRWLNGESNGCAHCGSAVGGLSLVLSTAPWDGVLVYDLDCLGVCVSPDFLLHASCSARTVIFPLWVLEVAAVL